jgi:hypothetical protein
MALQAIRVGLSNLADALSTTPKPDTGTVLGNVPEAKAAIEHLRKVYPPKDDTDKELQARIAFHVLYSIRTRSKCHVAGLQLVFRKPDHRVQCACTCAGTPLQPPHSNCAKQGCVSGHVC